MSRGQLMTAANLCRVAVYCSASEFRHQSEVCHLCFMAVLKLLICDLPANNYTLLSKATIPLFQIWILLVLERFCSRWFSYYTSLFHRGFSTYTTRMLYFFINNVLM